MTAWLFSCAKEPSDKICTPPPPGIGGNFSLNRANESRGAWFEENTLNSGG